MREYAYCSCIIEPACVNCLAYFICLENKAKSYYQDG